MADAWIPAAGRALDLAGGISGDALELAAVGLDVTVADISPVALAAVEAEAKSRGLSVLTCQVDLESEAIPAGPWEVITVGNFFDPAMMESITSELAPGGVVAVVVATIENLERNERPSRRFLAEPGQVRECLVGQPEQQAGRARHPALTVLHYDEAWRDNGRHEAHAVMTNDSDASLVRAKRRWRAVARTWTPGGFEIHSQSRELSAHLVDFVSNRLDAAAGSRVLVYDAMAGEPSLAAAIERWDPSSMALTRTPETGPLTVHPYSAPTQRHRYGYDQPHANAPTVPMEDLGVVLVPGLAFAHDGGRLGRGRGYYDRLLARLPPSTPRIGVAFDHMVLDRVPCEAHDVVMTHLVTPTGVRRVSPAPAEGRDG